MSVIATENPITEEQIDVKNYFSATPTPRIYYGITID
jgi:hypothetical protein